MTEKEFSCQNCGAPLANYARAELVRCKYCGTAFGDDDAGVEELQKETPDHAFKPPEPVKVSEFQKRTAKMAFDAVAGKLVSSIGSRLIAACVPYLVFAIIAAIVLIALFIWVIYLIFA